MATITGLVKGDSITLECSAGENITGWKIRCEIYDSSSHVIKKATANSGGSDSQIEITAVAEGDFSIHIDKAQTTEFDNDANIEIEMEDDTGKIWTVYQDKVEFTNEQIKWSTP